MGTKVIELTDEQIKQLEKQLSEIADSNTSLSEDDNVKYDVAEVEIDGLIITFDISINAYERYYRSATYDQPAEGESEIDIEIEGNGIAYDEDDNEIEVVCKQSAFEFIYEY